MRTRAVRTRAYERFVMRAWCCVRTKQVVCVRGTHAREARYSACVQWCGREANRYEKAKGVQVMTAIRNARGARPQVVLLSAC